MRRRPNIRANAGPSRTRAIARAAPRGLPGLRSLLGVLVVAGALLGAPPTAGTASATGPPHLAPKQGAYLFTLTFDGMTRDYRLHVPPAAAGGKSLPLVLNLHGSTQNALLQESYSNMDASSDQDGYLVAYPDGTDVATNLPKATQEWQEQFSWNAGACCGLPVTRRIDDVGFLLRVISNVASRTPVDLRRVYVTGMSAGGMMAYAMAAKASTHIAAIASVSGQVELPSIHPARPVPTLEFHSVDDPIAKWNGVPSANPKLRYSVMDGVHKWVRADGCRSTPHDGRPIVGAAGTTSSGESATLVTYTGCRSGSEVSLWRFTGSGHVWPGSPLNTGPRSTWTLDGVGRGITLIDANQVMWQFFKRYSLPRAR